MYQEVLFNVFQSQENSNSCEKENKKYSKGYEEKVSFGKMFNFSFQSGKIKRTIVW